MTLGGLGDGQTRIEAAHGLLEARSLDALVVTDLLNVRHLCSFTGSSGLLVLLPGRRVFLTDSRYTLQAREEISGAEVLESKELDETLREVLRDAGARTLGLEERTLPVGRWKKLGESLPDAERVDVSDAVDALRRCKSGTEICALRAASRLAEAAFREALPLVRPGAAELDVELAFHCAALRLGADALSFDTIVAGGPRGALPHAKPGSRRFEDGDLVVFDFGIRVGGYCSDETVTVPVGTVAGEARAVYDIVLSGQRAALAAVKPGVPLAEIDKAAREVIVAAGYGERFGHGTGHGVGLAVHEAPTVSHRSKETAEVGMVFTVEPGIYVPERFGVRLEECVVVTPEGCDSITAIPKDFGAVWA